MFERLLTRLFAMEEINGHERCPTYLYRWELVRLGKWLGVYLHKFVGDDWALDLHDHPKRFWSIGLSGGYREWTPLPLSDVFGPETARNTAECYEEFRAPWIRTFPATHVHRLTGPTPERPCWTLVIVGRASREWGFWHFGRFIHWKRYVAPGSVEADSRKACP